MFSIFAILVVSFFVSTQSICVNETINQFDQTFFEFNYDSNQSCTMVSIIWKPLPNLQFPQTDLNTLILMPPNNLESSSICFISTKRVSCWLNHTNTIVYHNASHYTKTVIKFVANESSMWTFILQDNQKHEKIKTSFSSFFIGLFLMMLVFTFCLLIHFVKHRMNVENNRT